MSPKNRHTSPSSPSRAPSRPSRRGAVIIIAAAALLLVTLAIVAITDPDADIHPDARTGRPGVAGSVMVGHIHAIAADPSVPGGDRVLVGAHHGLFVVDSDGNANVSRASTGAEDVMALTEAERGRLLASGHPEVTNTSQPPNLGLVESRDGGQTWTPVSLRGGADFHALEHTPTRTWGIDATTGGLLTSTDERTWETISGQPLFDLAVDPTDPDIVLVTTGDGQLIEVSADGDPQSRDEGPRLGYLDWATPDTLLGVDADGVVHRSIDAGHTWDELASVTGEPTALTIIEDRWYVATSDGLFRGDLDTGRDTSTDGGSGGDGQVTRILTFTD